MRVRHDFRVQFAERINADSINEENTIHLAALMCFVSSIGTATDLNGSFLESPARVGPADWFDRAPSPAGSNDVWSPAPLRVTGTFGLRAPVRNPQVPKASPSSLSGSTNLVKDSFRRMRVLFRLAHVRKSAVQWHCVRNSGKRGLACDYWIDGN